MSSDDFVNMVLGTSNYEDLIVQRAVEAITGEAMREPSALEWVPSRASNNTGSFGGTTGKVEITSPEERVVETQTETMNGTKGHWESMPTGDLLQRLQAVDHSIDEIDSEHQRLVTRLDELEKNRHAAENEKRELGLTVIKRLGFEDIFRQRPAPTMHKPERVLGIRGRSNPNKGKSKNNDSIREYLLHQPNHAAHASDIMGGFGRKITYFAAAAAIAKAAKDGVVRRGQTKGYWQLVEN